MTNSEPYSLDRVMAYLRLCKQVGTFGRTEIFWNGHEIVNIHHHQTLKPNDLPQVVQPT